MADPSFTTGGPELSWFQNLSVPDPYYILPALSCGMVYMSISVTHFMADLM